MTITRHAPTPASVYADMMANREAAERATGGSGNAYRLGRDGSPLPAWCQRGTLAHAAWRAGRDTRKALAKVTP